MSVRIIRVSHTSSCWPTLSIIRRALLEYHGTLYGPRQEVQVETFWRSDRHYICQLILQATKISSVCSFYQTQPHWAVPFLQHWLGQARTNAIANKIKYLVLICPKAYHEKENHKREFRSCAVACTPRFLNTDNRMARVWKRDLRKVCLYITLECRIPRSIALYTASAVQSQVSAYLYYPESIILKSFFCGAGHEEKSLTSVSQAHVVRGNKLFPY